MAEVILFHSVLGLRPGVIAAAERLRAAGHTVHTPDCYDGQIFHDLGEGTRKEEALGYRELARRARVPVAGLPDGLVFAGFCLGAVHAEVLAAQRPGAFGAVLMHGAVPVEDLGEYFGVERWPEGVSIMCFGKRARSTADYENICGVPGSRRIPGERPQGRPARRADRRTPPPRAAPRPW
jgi:dienelactone hydrolase